MTYEFVAMPFDRNTKGECGHSHREYVRARQCGLKTYCGQTRIVQREKYTRKIVVERYIP